MSIKEKLFSFLEGCDKEGISFLERLISIPSLPGEEEKAVSLVREKFSGLGRLRYLPIPEKIKEDPEYSRHTKELNYRGRGNLVVEAGANKGGKSLVISTHIDTVEGGRDFPEAFKPVKRGELIFGRGACDAKGQIVAVYLTLLALKKVGVRLKGRLRLHIVIEEEVGGNGALALIRQGLLGDGAIVLEATDFKIHPANRGALWFKIKIKGKPCHMGRKFEGINAIDQGMSIIKHLYQYEKKLIRESKNYPLFERYKYPVQLNIGMFHSGILPSMVAGEAEIEGGVGFLPNKNIAMIKRELKGVIEGIDDPWIKKNYTLEFNRLHNDAYFCNPKSNFVRTFGKSVEEAGIKSEVYGWNVSCDARLYAKLGHIPTIVFGPGEVARAHSREEVISIEDIIKASRALASFIVDWCGVT